MPKKILVVGSINMDLVVQTPRHPAVGETILGTSFHTYPGGKGANQAIAAARLGADVQIFGCVGDDEFGQTLLQNLTENRVDTRLMIQTGQVSSGTALITVDSKGSNSIIVVPGANHEITTSGIDQLDEALAEVGLILMQFEIPLQVVWSMVEIARSRHIPVILNPAPAHQIPKQVLNGLDYLVPNEVELNLLTGISTDSLVNIQKAANVLLERGVKNVVITRGSQGCYFKNSREEIILPAHEVTSVDSTAAGDAFIGGFASALIKGQDIAKCLSIGMAAGAIAVTKPGAQTSLPTQAEIDKFIRI